MDGPHFFGSIVYHVVLDPRDRTTVMCATSAGHLGPALMRSADGGATWKQVTTPPTFAKGEPRGRAVNHIFWLTPGHASQPGTWFAGTSPQGLFRSVDGGEYFGTTSGEVWASADEGGTWSRLAEHLPHIYSVTVV